MLRLGHKEAADLGGTGAVGSMNFKINDAPPCLLKSCCLFLWNFTLVAITSGILITLIINN